jgi:hypothetical protein
VLGKEFIKLFLDKKFKEETARETKAWMEDHTKDLRILRA